MSQQYIRTSARRAAAVGFIASGVLVATMSAAQAHVTVASANATQGGFSTLAFKVPNESATASTNKISVELPSDTPFAFVSTRPVPGWTIKTTTTKLAKPMEVEGFTIDKAVSTVTWTADAKTAAVAPGEFQVFEISAGPLPTQESVSFNATQTYTDGEVVKWNETTGADGKEPEHPAPTLELASADAEQASAETEDSSNDSLGIILGGVGIVLGLIGIAIGLTGRRRSA